nr:uncharacterized protein LOC126536296 [Dermacentor andersoni]
MATSAPSRTGDNFPSSEESIDDCELSPVSSTDDEAPNGLCSLMHSFTTSSKDSSMDYLALRSDDHVGLDGGASSTDMALPLPSSYVERPMSHNMPRKVSAPQGTKADPTKTFSSIGDSSYSWCYLELERLTSTISIGAEYRGTIADLETPDGQLRRNNINSSLSSDPNICQTASRATIDGPHFSTASGNYAKKDHVFDTAAPRGTTGDAATNGNIKSGWSTRTHESAFVQPPLLSTMYAHNPHMIIGIDDQIYPGTVKAPVASATSTKENRKSQSNVPNCSASTIHAPVQLPMWSSAVNPLRADIASLWEKHALIIARANNSERYDLRKNVNMSSFRQQKHSRPAPHVEDLCARPGCSTSVSAADAEELPPVIVKAQYERKHGLLASGMEKECSSKEDFRGNAFRRLNTDEEMHEASQNTWNIGRCIEFDKGVATSSYRRRLLDPEPASTAPATKSSKRKTHQNPQPERNKRTRRSSINKDAIGLPISELDRKKDKGNTKVQDMPSNQQIRMHSNSAEIDEEMGSTHQFDDSSQSPMRPSATETAHRDASYSRIVHRRTYKENRAANNVAVDEHLAIPLCLLQQYDDFYAGASNNDPRMLSGWKPGERLGMRSFSKGPKLFSRPAQD